MDFLLWDTMTFDSRYLLTHKPAIRTHIKIANGEYV